MNHIDSFWENRKRPKLTVFYIFLDYFSMSFSDPSCTILMPLCTQQHTWVLIITLVNFIRIVWTVFEEFEIFVERSGEKTIAYVVESFSDSWKIRTTTGVRNRRPIFCRVQWDFVDWNSQIKLNMNFCELFWAISSMYVGKIVQFWKLQ